MERVTEGVTIAFDDERAVNMQRPRRRGRSFVEGGERWLNETGQGYGLSAPFRRCCQQLRNRKGLFRRFLEVLGAAADLGDILTIALVADRAEHLVMHHL